ncbi:MAG: DUF378 domain-containing protein [Bacilli bacterium]
MKFINNIGILLIIFGTLNLGLIGLFNFDLLFFIVKNNTNFMYRLICSLIGISSIIFMPKFLEYHIIRKH